MGNDKEGAGPSQRVSKPTKGKFIITENNMSYIFLRLKGGKKGLEKGPFKRRGKFCLTKRVEGGGGVQA